MFCQQYKQKIQPSKQKVDLEGTGTVTTMDIIVGWEDTLRPGVEDCLICSKLQYLTKVWPGSMWFCICPIWSLILADHFPVTLPLLHRWSLVSFFLQDCSGLYFPTGDLAIEETLVTCDKEADVCYGKVAKVVFFFRKVSSLFPGGPDCVKQFQQ